MQPPIPDAPTRWQRVRARVDAYERLLRLDKPIGIALLLWPTLSALWLATGGAPSWLLVVVFVAGTVLMRSAGCAVNDWADRRFDAHVERTAARPVATGEVAPWEALALAAVLAFCAFLLVLATNRVAVFWSFPAALIAFVYPFFKRFFALPQAFLGIAFSFGIPMAFAAAQGQVPAFAWALLVINLGIRTSAITFGRFDVAAVAACYAAHVAGMAWVGIERSLGPIYFTSVAVAAAIAVHHLVLIRHRERTACFRAFLHNHWLGLAIFAGIALDYAVRLSAWPQR